MAETAGFAQAQLPGTDDIRKVVALLREDMTSDVRLEAADRLVVMAGQETHPVAKAALLERAAKLVIADDEPRAVMLLREAFRLHPRLATGELLRDHVLESEVLRRLGRGAALMDSLAALTTDEQARRDALFAAAAYHLGQGYGHRATATLERLRELGAGEREDEIEQLAAAAQALIAEREETLGAKRQQIVDAPDEFRSQILREYAELLLAGDEPLADASAVLEDAVEGGADGAAPLWAEVARAVGEKEMLARALAACLSACEAPGERLRYADELANLEGIADFARELLLSALAALVEAMPDDLPLRARWVGARAGAGDPDAAAELEALRRQAAKARDRGAEAVTCLALARLAHAAGDEARVERHLRRVRTLDPRNAEALDYFEQRFRKAGDHERLFVVLTHRLAISTGEVAAELALEMAHIADGPAGDPERAIEAYHAVLSAVPDHAEALERLEALYREAGRWPAVIDLLERRARLREASDDPEQRRPAAAILERLAALYAEDGPDPDPASLHEVWQRIHAVDPGHAEAGARLAERYRRDGRWRRLASVLHRREEFQKEPEERARIARELHDLYRNRLGDVGRAVAALERLVAAAPVDLQALRMLEDAYRRNGDDAGRLRVMARIRPLVEGDELVALLETMAALTEHVDDVPGAIELFEALGREKPGHMAARRALTRLYARAARHAELATLIEERLAQEELDREEKAGLYESLARISAAHLDDLERAEKAARSLRRIKPESQIGTDIAERAMIARGDFQGLRGLFGDDAESAERFVATLEKVGSERSDVLAVRCLLAAASAADGELRDAAGGADLAARALEVALGVEEAAATEDAARMLLSLAQSAGRTEARLRAIAALVEHSRGEELRLHLAMRVALFEEIEDFDGALSAVTELVATRIVEGDLEDLEGAADRVVDLAERAGQDEDLPALLCAWADVLIERLAQGEGVASDSREAALALLDRALDMALVLGQEVDPVRAGIDALIRQGESAELHELREQVCTEQGDWEAVVESLRRRAELLPESGRPVLLLRAASRAESALKNAEFAASLYRQVVELRPDDSAAWSGLLETRRALGDPGALAAALEAFLASPAPDRAAKASAAIDRVGQLMDAEADAATFNAVLLPRLRELVAADSLADIETGLLAVAAGRLELGEEVGELAEALLEAARKHGRPDLVLRCHEALAAHDGGEDDDARLRRELDMARIAAGELDEREQAVEHLGRALALRPSSDEVWQALAALDPGEEERTAWTATLLALLGAGDVESVEPLAEAADRAAIARRWAEEAQGRDDRETAVQAYALLREAEPGAVDALDALEVLYREAEDHDAVAHTLEERLRVVQDAEDREQSWIRLVSLHLDERDDRGDAAECLERAVLDQPRSASLWAQRLGLLREGPAAARLEALDKRLGLLGEAADEQEARQEAEALARERAALLADLPERAADALSAWVGVAEASPEDDEAVAAAFTLLSAQEGLSGEAPGAVARLGTILEVRGDHRRLDAVLQARIDAAAAEARPALLREQLALREGELKDRKAAFATASAAFRLAPRDGALFAAVERLAGPDDAEARLALAEVRANAREDPAGRLELLLEHARQAQQAGALEAAARSWRSVLEGGEREARIEAAAALVECYEAAGSPAELARAYLAQRELAEDLESRAALSVMAAEQLHEAGASDEALAVLREAEQGSPEDLAVWTALREALHEGADHAALAAHLEKGWQELLVEDENARLEAVGAQLEALAAAGAPAPDRWDAVRAALDAGLRSEALRTQLAELAELSDDPAMALAARRRWLEVAAQTGAAIDTRAGERALARALEQAAEGDPKARAELLEEALGVWLDRIGDAERGMAVLDRLLEDAPDRLDLADRRLDVMRLSAHEGYVPALHEAVRAAREAGDRSRLATLLPRLLQARAGELEAGRRFELMAEFAELSASPASLAAFVDAMAEQADELEPARAATALGWLRANTDAAAEPEKWASVRLRELELLDDEVEQLAVLDELFEHAIERLRDPESAAQWGARALLVQPESDERAQALLRLDPTGDAAATVVSALQAALLRSPREGSEAASLYAGLLHLAPEDEDSLEVTLTACADRSLCEALVPEVVPELCGAGAHAAAVALDRALLEHLAAEDRGDALLRLAGTLAGELGRADEAVKLLVGEAPALPEPHAALEAGLELAREHGVVDEWLDGVDVLLGDEKLRGDAGRVSTALAASVALDDAGDATRAAELWLRAWDAVPDDDDARDMVLAMRREAGDAEALGADLERAVARGGEDALELGLELASLYHAQLGRPRDALGRLRTVLRAEPDRDDAIALAEQLAAEPATALAALELLCGIYRAAGRWAELADALARRAERRGDGRAARDLADLARIQRDRLGDGEAARASFAAALEIAPSQSLLEQALALCESEGAAVERARLYRLALAGELAAEERLEVLASAATHAAERENDPAKAEALWRDLLSAHPSSPAAYEGLDSIYEGADRWDDLLELLEERLEHARDAADEQAILHRLAGIAAAVQRNDIAIDAFERLDRLDPDEPEHLEQAIELLRPGQDPRRLAALLERRAERAEKPADKARALTEAAHLASERLHEQDRAEELFVAAFDLDPGADEAFTWLERHLAGDKAKLLKLYRHRCTGVGEGPGLIRVLRKLAAVYSEFGHGARARAVLEKALSHSPENKAIEDDLLALCELHGDHEGFEAVASRRLKGELPRAERAELLTKLVRGTLAADGDADRWLKALREVGADPAELRGLESMVQARSRDPEQAAEGLERIARTAETASEQLEALERLLDLYTERLDQSQRAIATCQRILKLEPRRADMQRRLTDLFAARGSHEARIETLRKWLAVTPEGVEQVPILADLGRALLDQGRDRQALVTFEKAHELDPDRLEVNESLAVMLAADGQHDRAAELQARVVQALRKRRERARLATAAAFAGELHERSGDLRRAQRYFRMALHADRSAREAVLGLGRTFLASGDPHRAMAEFEKVSIAGEGVTVAQRAAALVGEGRCWLAQGKQAHARNAFNRALAIEPGHREALEELNRA